MDISNILIWNVRGLNRKSRRDGVRDMVLSTRPDLVCLQETKKEAISRRMVMSMLGSEFDNFIFLPAQGTRGGILLAWKGTVCNVINSRIDSFSVSLLIAHGGDTPWWFTGVYGPQSDNLKLAFIQELRTIRASCSGPWAVGGDFNLIYRAEDKNNSNLDRAMMGRFRRLLNDLELKELELLGRRYTWSNERASPTLVRLDRLFYTTDWEIYFPNCILQSSATMFSDHCPLLLGLKDNHWGKRRFHFEPFWPKFEGFHDAVSSAWNSVQNISCPLKTLSLKLKATAKGLQCWE